MGIDISGLVINKNYKNDFEKLQKELGWFLQKEEIINFELAASNWKDSEICDVYFSEKGTLIFISMDICGEPLTLKRENTLTFAISETEMAFDLNYCERGVLERSIIEVEHNRMTDEGEKLDVEDYYEDTSEIIWNQLEVVLGKSFWDIEPDEKAIRYRFIKKEQRPNNIQQEKEKEVYKTPSTNNITEIDTKKWWKFW